MPFPSAPSLAHSAVQRRNSSAVKGIAVGRRWKAFTVGVVFSTVVAGLTGVGATSRAAAAGLPAWAGASRLSSAAERFLALRAGTLQPSSSTSNAGHACAAEPSTTGNVQVNCVAEDGTSPQNTQSETSVAAFGSTVVVGYNDSLVCCTAINFSGYSVSTDAGRTFTDMGDVPWRAKVQPEGDPAVAVDDKGNFYYASLATAGLTKHAHSLLSLYRMAAGTTHFVFDSVVADAGDSSKFFADKEYLAIGRDSHGVQHFYVTWTFFSPVVFSPIQLSESTDGKLWRQTQLAPAQTCDQSSNPVPAGDTLYVSWEQSQPVACVPGSPNPAAVEVMATVNVASGQATRLTPIASISGSGDAIVACNNSQDLREVIHTAPGHDARTFELPSTTIDSGGALYAVWQDRPSGLGGAPSNATAIWLSFSLDGNRHWSAPQLISGANATGFYADRWQPWVTADGTGVHAMWYQEVAGGQVRADKEDLSLATATAKPHSASGEQTISSRTFPIVQTNPNQDPVPSNCYMGDYNNIATAAGTHYVTWGDNRNVAVAAGIGLEHQPDVFLGAY
jgi:hypothetical protein